MTGNSAKKPECDELSKAVAANNAQAVQELLGRGADFNEETDYIGRTPLAVAADNGYMQIAGLLIDHGADADNAGSGYSLTPLMMALQKDHLKTARLLIERGANIHACDQGCNTVMTYAVRATEAIDIVRLLLDKGVSANAVRKGWDAPLSGALSKGNLKTARLLIERGADVNAEDGYGWTPIRYCRDGDMMQVLIDKGADIDHKDRNGLTPLMNIVERGVYGTTKLLLEKGADTAIRNKEGKTALDIAQELKSYMMPQIVALLNEHAEQRPHRMARKNQSVLSTRAVKPVLIRGMKP